MIKVGFSDNTDGRGGNNINNFIINNPKIEINQQSDPRQQFTGSFKKQGD